MNIDNFSNLVKTISLFSINSGLCNEQVLYFFNKAVETGIVEIEKLKKEFNIALEDSSFKWIDFATLCDILENPQSYREVEIQNYTKGLIWDYLYPEIKISDEIFLQLSAEIIFILKNYTSNEGWIFSYTLYEMLKKKSDWQNLEYYQLWNINFKSINIERKLENIDKIYEIGFLKYMK